MQRFAALRLPSAISQPYSPTRDVISFLEALQPVLPFWAPGNLLSTTHFVCRNGRRVETRKMTPPRWDYMQETGMSGMLQSQGRWQFTQMASMYSSPEARSSLMMLRTFPWNKRLLCRNTMAGDESPKLELGLRGNSPLLALLPFFEGKPQERVIANIGLSESRHCCGAHPGGEGGAGACPSEKARPFCVRPRWKRGSVPP